MARALQQHVPVRLAGLAGEGRGNGQEIGARLRQGPIQVWEAQVVAHRQPQRSPGQVGEHGAIAGLIVLRLAVGLAARQLHVEHVDLVEARLDLVRPG